MIKSLDRITYLASSLERAEKTFSSFFNLKPSKRVISAKKNYESLIYIFENMCFEVIEKKDDLSEKTDTSTRCRRYRVCMYEYIYIYI